MRLFLKKSFFRNYEIFSSDISAREKQRQNNAEPQQGVIGSLVIPSVGGSFEFVCLSGRSSAAIFHVVAFSLSNS